MSRSNRSGQGYGKKQSRSAQQTGKRSWLVIALIAILAVGGLSALFLRRGGAPSVQPVEAASVATANPVAPSTASQASPAEPKQSAAQDQDTGPSVVQANNGLVRIALTDLVGQEAKFYTYQDGNKAIPFFVMRSSDGVVRAAFDACDVCFASKKGYHQEGDEMVCNNCGSRFASTQINEVKGGCNPSPLDRTEQNDELILKADDLQAGAKYF